MRSQRSVHLIPPFIFATLPAILPLEFPPLQEASTMVDVGQSAPDFTLKDQNGEDVSLAGFKGEKWVVIHSFPAAFTGG